MKSLDSIYKNVQVTQISDNSVNITMSVEQYEEIQKAVKALGVTE